MVFQTNDDIYKHSKSMPSSTEKQRRFFQAVKRAKHDPSYGSARVKKVAASMSDSDIDDFASSVSEVTLAAKKALLSALKDCREPMYLDEAGDGKVNPIAKEFHVKDKFDEYVKRYVGQPLSQKELEAINTFKEVKPSKVERTQIWYETTDEFQNSSTTVVKKMKDGTQFSFNAFTKHSSAQPEEPESPPMGEPTQPAGTEPETPMEEEKDDIVVSKSPLFKDEIEGGAILVEFLKKLDL